MPSKAEREATERINKTTVDGRILEWTQNFQANQEALAGAYGVVSLINTLPNVPFILVGSGPTLDRNMHELVGLEDKAFIIAAASNLKVLQDIGVHPHLVIMADSLANNLRCLDGVEMEKYNFVVDTFIHPDTATRLKDAKRLYWYNSPHLEVSPFTARLTESTGAIGIVTSGGCGATAGWSIGKSVCSGDPAILVGLPEAYYDPGHHYSPAVEKTHGVTTYLNVEETVDMYGVLCYTNPAYRSFADWFEHAAVALEGTFINCSQGGIISKGHLIMSLAMFKDNHLQETYDIESMLFQKELLADEYTAHVPAEGDSEGGEDYRSFLTMMVDGSSVPELARRMKWTNQKVAQIVIEFRKVGVNISEDPVWWNAGKQQTLIFKLEAPILDMSVPFTEADPDLVEVCDG